MSREAIHEWSSRHVAPGDLVALGDTTARLSEWVAALNLSPEMVRSRIANGDMIFQALRPTKATRASVAVRCEHDPGVMQFIDDNHNGAERSDVGEFLGLTRERIRQIEESGLRKMREAMGADISPEKQAKTDRVRELVAKNVDPSAITARLGVTIGAVWRARQERRRDAA